MIASNGLLVVGSADSNVYGIDPATGAQVWKLETPASAREPALGTDGAIYVPSSDFGGSGGAYVLKVSADGREIWRYTAAGFVLTPLVTASGVVIVPMIDGSMGRIDAIDPVDRRQIWTRAAPSVAGLPVLHPAGLVLVPIGMNLLAIDALSGSDRWTQPFTDRPSTAAVAPDGTIVVPAGNALIALDPATGVEVWRTDVGFTARTPTIGPDGTMYVPEAQGTNGGTAPLLAIAPDRSQRWRWRAGAATWVDSPGVTSDGTVYLPTTTEGQNEFSGDWTLRALDPVSGVEKWSFDVDGYIDPPIEGANGTLYASGLKLVLYALSPETNAVSLDQLSCAPCGLSCESDTIVSQCLPDGSSQSSEPAQTCTTGFGCKDGACIECTPEASVRCHEGHPTYFDACGEVGTRKETCGSGENCRSGECGVACSLTCSATRSGISVGLTCGTNSRTCNNGYDSSGRINRLNCSYSNGRSFSCSIRYNSVGEPSGTCQGEGDTCRF